MGDEVAHGIAVLSLNSTGRSRVNNLQRCVICGKSGTIADVDSFEFSPSKGYSPLKLPTANTFSVFRQAAIDRHDELLKDALEENVTWHWGCYKSYTSKNNIRNSLGVRRKIKFEEDEPSRAKREKPDWEVCLFCGNLSFKKDRYLCDVTTESRSAAILAAAESRGDEVLLRKIRGENLINKGKYHRKCGSNYLLTKPSPSPSEPDIYSTAFTELHEFLSETLFSGKFICEMSTVLERYRNILFNHGLPKENANKYTAQNLKRKLTDKFQEKIRFYDQYDSTKSQLIANASVTQNDIMKYLSNLVSALPDQSALNPETEVKPAETVKDPYLTIYEAGTIIRRSILDCKKYEGVLPKELDQFLNVVIGGKEPGGAGDGNINEKVRRQVSSIGGDIMFAVSKGHIQPEKNIQLAYSICQKTASREIINIANRLGHCISYPELLKHENDTVHQQHQHQDIFIPKNIKKRPGVLIQAASDNLDFKECTLDGSTSHVTTLILFQPGDFYQGPLLRRSPRTHIESNTTISGFLSGQNCQFLHEDTTDHLWLMARMAPMKITSVDTQKIQGWSAFHAKISVKDIPKHELGYCEIFPTPATDLNTVYNVINTTMKMMQQLGQRWTIITFDLALYAKAKQVVQKNHEKFGDTVILRLGGFHMILSFLSAIGKFYRCSGLEDVLVESGIYGPSTSGAVLSGSHYNRSIRCHKLVYEALSQLQIDEFIKHRTNQEDEFTIFRRYRGIEDSLDKVCEEPSVKSLFTDLLKYRYEMCTASKTFAYWQLYMDLVSILLQFIKSERECEWIKHLEITAQMTPYMFASDHQNYSRYLLLYLQDMIRLPAEVKLAFESGQHSVSRSGRPFSAVSTDMVLEQSLNRDAKTAGGLVGKSRSSDSINRWIKGTHIRASMTSQLQDMCKLNSKDDTTHSESTLKRYQKDLQSVQKIRETITGLVNPFTYPENDCLVNIATGISAPTDVSKDLGRIKTIGKERMDDFVKRRMVDKTSKIQDPITRCSLKTFANSKKPVKIAGKKVNVAIHDAQLFQRLLIAANSRDVNLRTVLAYELTPTPLSLANSDGSLLKPTKSKLMNLVVEECESEISRDDYQTQCVVIDGMMIIHAMATDRYATFGDLASSIFAMINSRFSAYCHLVHVVMDRYGNPLSIKGGEHDRRSGDKIEVRVITAATPVPRQWKKFLASDANKIRLLSFLQDELIKIGMTSMKEGDILVLGGFSDERVVRIRINVVVDENAFVTSQEEADTRIIFHIYRLLEDNRHITSITVECADTDVFVLMVHYFQQLSKICRNKPAFDMVMKCGIGQSVRRVSIRRTSEKLGHFSGYLMPVHALTGCDSVSSFRTIGKIKPWSILKEDVESYGGIKGLGSTVPVAANVYESCEKLIRKSYSKVLNCENIDELRYRIFCQKKNCNAIPPTADSFSLHVQRANYQAAIWNSALLSNPCVASPVGNGYEMQGDVLVPTLMTKESAPTAIAELITCKCTGKCGPRCPCVKQGNDGEVMLCIDACGCSLDCGNRHVLDNDDDTDDADLDDNDDILTI